LSGPAWGHLYDFELEGAKAEAVLVVSEDEWNARTRDAVIVPVYREPGTAAGNVRIAVDDELVADCTRVQNVAQETLGADRGPCPREPMLRVRIGIRVYLDIDRLLKRAGPRTPPAARDEWWPHQGEIRYAELPQFPGDKMFCVISDDDWNSRATTIYSAGLRLTSKAREWRSRWEVTISNGWIVAGHLYSLLHEDIDPSAPKAPRPQEASVEELHELADRLSVMLKLR
jgi:mRNA-degrading endonuclease toxin of MazEF toxin-antitoxin module